MSVTWNCPHDSWNYEGMTCFEETSVKVTFKTLLCPYYHRKIAQVNFSDKKRILYILNRIKDRTKVFIE